MVKKVIYRRVEIFFILFFSFCNLVFSRSSDSLKLIPGVGFYNLRIGDEIYKAGIIFGKPDFRIGEQIGTIYYFSMGIYINYENNVITHIAVVLKPYKKYIPFKGTIDGRITVDSTKKDIEKALGKRYELLKGYRGICAKMMIYEDLKMVFFLDKNDKLVRAVVFK